MSDWKTIIEAEFNEPEQEGVCSFIVRGNDHNTHEYLILKEAGAWVPQLLADQPVTLDHGAQFMASLAEVRADLNSRLSWHMLLELIAPDEDATKLCALYERETGITEDEAFPAHLDPDEQEQEPEPEPEGVAVAERLALEQARLVEERERERRERVLERRAYLAHRHRDTDDDADDEAEEALEASNRETALTLANRSDEAEIPPGAMTNYRGWLQRFDANDEEALDTYQELGGGLVNEVGITALAYRIDGTDEILILGLIFGEDFAEAVQDVMTDTFMNRWDEAPHPQNRVRSRLWAGCPAVDDATLIRMDATRRIGDADLLSLKPGTVVVADEDHVCHDSGLTIPAGERHLLADGDGTRHSLAAAWCHVVLGNVALARALQPEEPPLLLPL